MRYFESALFASAFVLIMFIASLWSSTAHASIEDVPLGTLKIRVMGEIQSPPANNTCSTFQSQVKIAYIGEVTACIWGGSRDIVTYYANDGFHIAASIFPGEKRYTIRGVCDGVMLCMYAPESDTAIEKVFAEYPQKQLIVTKRVSEWILLQTDVLKAQYYYDYKEIEKRRSIVGNDAAPANIEMAGFSKNGEWLAVELTNRGTGLVNVRSLSLKRITDQAHQYGVGMDPRQELAVSNDGSRVMVAGSNSGFVLIAVNSTCGEEWKKTASIYFGSQIEPCRQSGVDIGQYVPGAQNYHRPQFIGAGAMVYVYTQTVTKVLAITTNDQPYGLVEYLALGDSFVSGEGETDNAEYIAGTNEHSDRCHVSKRSYPFLLLKSQTKNVACSGAKIGDVLGGDQYWGQNDMLRPDKDRAILKADALHQFLPGKLPQLQFLEYFQPAAATISIGGNDAGLMEKVRDCVKPGICTWIKPENLERTAQEIKALYPTFVKTFTQLQVSAPTTRKYVIGYPDVLKLPGKCDLLTNSLLSESERAFLSRSVLYLNQVIAAATRSTGTVFVDMDGVFNEHALCGSADKQAMNGLRFGNDVALTNILPEFKVIGNESFHPTPYGHTLIASALSRQTGGLSFSSCGTVCALVETAPLADTYWRVSKSPTRSLLLPLTHRIIPEDQQSVMVKMDRSPFKAGSEVSIQIGLNANQVVTGVVKNSGALQEEVRLFESLRVGTYLIHVIGQAADGELLDGYQEIEVAAKTNMSTSQTLTGTDVVSEIKTRGISNDSTPAMKSENSMSNVQPLQETALLKNTINPNSSNVPEKNNWFYIAAFVSAGIIVVCLLFAAVSRK